FLRPPDPRCAGRPCPWCEPKPLPLLRRHARLPAKDQTSRKLPLDHSTTAVPAGRLLANDCAHYTQPMRTLAFILCSCLLAWGQAPSADPQTLQNLLSEV